MYTDSANSFLFLFCEDPTIDPLAPRLLELALKCYGAKEKHECSLAGKPVFESWIDSSVRLVFAATRTVASYQYYEIASDLNKYFSDAALISVVNWHAGNNAPEKIFCAHTTAEIVEGYFPPASALKLSAVLRTLEAIRKEKGLSEWRTLVEASHWSGSMVGRPASEILDIKAPVIDLEIGSYAEDWSNSAAHEVMVETFGAIPKAVQIGSPSIVFFGGTHFEPALSEALLQKSAPINLGLVLPNQWLVQGNYEGLDGVRKIQKALLSLVEPVAGLCFHDNLKSCYKTAVKEAAQALGLPVFNHKKLRDMSFLEGLGTR